jgi:hypothetical protein
VSAQRLQSRRNHSRRLQRRLLACILTVSSTVRFRTSSDRSKVSPSHNVSFFSKFPLVFSLLTRLPCSSHGQYAWSMKFASNHIWSISKLESTLGYQTYRDVFISTHCYPAWLHAYTYMHAVACVLARHCTKLHDFFNWVVALSTW